MRLKACAAVWLALVLTVGCSSSGSRRTSPPPDPESVNTMGGGVTLYREGRFAEAEAALERYTSSHATDPEGWAYLGLSRVKLGELEEAEPPLRRALELNPDNANAHFGLGLARASTRRIDEAIAELRLAVGSDPSHAYAHYHLGLAYNEKGQTDLALLHLQRFLSLAPDAPEAPMVRSLLARLG